ncbi:unnamed protein product [Eruca vesicaria subsp. sativa]|uniref:F-box domain-containing protein n=1 Tax=Eruca vesicaria subsp. sativa TaxID=29727 RepID=A0ABC8LMJ3_ERUVS|nr:unnamed protein product [Eruca vesicaria subsp. sativa]
MADICNDVVEDILVRLPVKSILRFKSVSRRWKSLMESERFVQRHVKNSRRKILLALDSDGAAPSLFLFGEEEHQEEEEEKDIWYIRNCDASIASLTCDGLICIPRSDSIQVCNPATRESRRFPPGEHLSSSTEFRKGKRIPIASLVHIQHLNNLVAGFPTRVSTFGFGKDEVTGTYKVVELRGNDSGSNLVLDCNVLDLETGQWRQLGVVPHRIFITERSVYVNGSVHWFTVDLWELDAPGIVAFDLHTEEFRVISYPNFSSDAPLSAELLSLGENRLSVSEMRATPDVHLHIWTMVDETWVKMHSICLCRLYKPRLGSLQRFTPVLISKQGDGVVFFFLWDYQHTLFKSSTNTVFTQKIYTDARVVDSSYIPTLVPVPIPCCFQCTCCMFGKKPVEQFLKALDELTLKDTTNFTSKIISKPLTMDSFGDVFSVPSYDTVSSKFC